MKMTSSQVNKLIRQFGDELKTLEAREAKTRTFVAATVEDIESVRPEYDYDATQEAIIALETKIRKAKHALNLFNAETMVPGFDMTPERAYYFIQSQRKPVLQRRFGFMLQS